MCLGLLVCEALKRKNVVDDEFDSILLECSKNSYSLKDNDIKSCNVEKDIESCNIKKENDKNSNNDNNIDKDINKYNIFSKKDYSVDFLLSNNLLPPFEIRHNLPSILIRAIKSKTLLSIHAVSILSEYGIEKKDLDHICIDNDIEMANYIRICEYVNVCVCMDIINKKMFYDTSIEHILKCKNNLNHKYIKKSKVENNKIENYVENVSINDNKIENVHKEKGNIKEKDDNNIDNVEDNNINNVEENKKRKIIKI